MAEPISRPVGTAFEQAVALLNQHTLLPKCIAFMLDRVLWHCSSTSPDSAEEAMLYPHAVEILAALHTKGITAAACQSTVSTPTGALEQLSSAGYRLIMVCNLKGAGALADCLADVRRQTGIAVSETLVFAADVASVRAAASVGATGWRVRNGITCADLDKGPELAAMQQLSELQALTMLQAWSASVRRQRSGHRAYVMPATAQQYMPATAQQYDCS